jgi:flagellar protein FliO/FliZ
LDSITFFWSFVKMLFALALVIVMMIAAMYLLKKYFYNTPASINGNDAMVHIISNCYLGPKNNILLIEVLGQIMLLGVSNHQMSILGTITDPSAIENLKGIRNKEKNLPASDALARYKSLFRNISQMRKVK